MPFTPIILITAGTYFYRRATRDNLIPRTRATFYALNQAEVSVYQGIIPGSSLYIVRATRNLYVLDMRFVRVFKAILQGTNQQGRRVIRHAFFSGMDAIDRAHLDTINRRSEWQNDRVYTDALCTPEYRDYLKQFLHIHDQIDGFLFPNFTDARSEYTMFHAEIIICQPHTCLEVITDDPRQIRRLAQTEPWNFLSTLRQIRVNQQLQIEQAPYTKIQSQEQFLTVIGRAQQISARVISRTSAFSFIIKSVYFTREPLQKFSLIQKITKYNYNANRQARLPRHSKHLIDSYLLEYLNGLSVNEIIRAHPELSNLLILTYDLVFLPDTTLSDNILTQIQKDKPFQTSVLKLWNTHHFQQRWLQEPLKLCKKYHDSRFTLITQECIDDNVTFIQFIQGHRSYAKAKLLNTIIFVFTIYEVLSGLFEWYQFTHNDLHLGNVLLNKSQPHIWHNITTQWCPIIIDYGRSSTPKSREFLAALELNQAAKRVCQWSRTTNFKNSSNPSIDLLLLASIRTEFGRYLNTGTRDDQIQMCKVQFQQILDDVPQEQYFREVLRMEQERPTYNEWCRAGRHDIKSITTVNDAHARLLHLVSRFRDIFTPDNMRL